MRKLLFIFLGLVLASGISFAADYGESGNTGMPGDTGTGTSGTGTMGTGGSTMGTTSTTAGQIKMAQGTVDNVTPAQGADGKTEITVKEDNGNTTKISAGMTATVYDNNSNKVPVSQLKKGDKVKVTYSSKDGMNEAKSINIQR